MIEWIECLNYDRTLLSHEPFHERQISSLDKCLSLFCLLWLNFQCFIIGLVIFGCRIFHVYSAGGFASELHISSYWSYWAKSLSKVSLWSSANFNWMYLHWNRFLGCFSVSLLLRFLASIWHRLSFRFSSFITLKTDRKWSGQESENLLTSSSFIWRSTCPAAHKTMLDNTSKLFLNSRLWFLQS